MPITVALKLKPNPGPHTPSPKPKPKTQDEMPGDGEEDDLMYQAPLPCCRVQDPEKDSPRPKHAPHIVSFWV